MTAQLSKTKTVADLKSKLLKQTAAGVKRTGALVQAFPMKPADPSVGKTDQVVVHAVEGERPGLTAAKKLLKNRVQSALVMKELVYAGANLMEVEDHCAVLRAQGEVAATGDISDLKAMLAVQAVVLDGIFTQFARRAALAKSVDDIERMMRVSLRAQSQSRCAVESLAMIQQGPPIFAKQANIAQNGGQQQVNNGVSAVSAPALQPRARARSKKLAKPN